MYPIRSILEAKGMFFFIYHANPCNIHELLFLYLENWINNINEFTLMNDLFDSSWEKMKNKTNKKHFLNPLL